MKLILLNTKTLMDKTTSGMFKNHQKCPVIHTNFSAPAMALRVMGSRENNMSTHVFEVKLKNTADIYVRDFRYYSKALDETLLL